MGNLSLANLPRGWTTTFYSDAKAVIMRMPRRPLPEPDQYRTKVPPDWRFIPPNWQSCAVLFLSRYINHDGYAAGVLVDYTNGLKILEHEESPSGRPSVDVLQAIEITIRTPDFYSPSLRSRPAEFPFKLSDKHRPKISGRMWGTVRRSGISA